MDPLTRLHFTNVLECIECVHQSVGQVLLVIVTYLSSLSTQVKIDGSKRARCIDGPVTGSEPVITGPLLVRYGPVTRPLRARINNKNNGTVADFQAVKCRYIEGSKNGPVTGPFGHGPVRACQLLPVYRNCTTAAWPPLTRERLSLISKSAFSTT